MVEEARARALAVDVLLLEGRRDPAVGPPQNWPRMVRLCALLLAEIKEESDG